MLLSAGDTLLVLFSSSELEFFIAINAVLNEE